MFNLLSISDSFLNSSMILLFNKNHGKTIGKDLYQNMIDIIDKCGDNLPVDLVNKVALMKKMCEMKLEGNTIEHIYDNVIIINKFKEFDHILKLNINLDVDDVTYEKVLKEFTRKNNALWVVDIGKDINNINDVLSDGGDFESVNDITEYVQDTVISINSSLMKRKRIALNANSRQCTIGVDCTQVFRDIITSYSSENRVKSGYDYLDKHVLSGGFTRGNVYVIAGATGSGKSTLMSNLFVNAFKRKSENKKLFLYISLENSLRQAMHRIYCPFKDITTNNFMNELLSDPINKPVEFNNVFTQHSKENNNLIECVEHSPNDLRISDIYPKIDECLEKYKGIDLSGVYVDYLSLLKSVEKKELRHTLGDFVLDLKTLARDFNCPVITAAQLNRSASKVKNSFELSLDMVGESHAISQNSDFMLLIAGNVDNTKLVHAKVCKNRDGAAHIPIDFSVDLERLKFIECNRSTSNRTSSDDEDINSETTFKNVGVLEINTTKDINFL